MRTFLMMSITIFFGIFLFLLMAETVLRFLPVSQSTKTQPVNAANPILHFLPNQDIVRSKGWNFQIVAKKHSNNYGYFSDVDFTPKGTLPRMVIIGDSYVEACQVENSESMHGRLHNRLKGRGEVFGIGMSGSPLSQYLKFAEFSHQKFTPESMVFVIVGNDFNESLKQYKFAGGGHFFAKENGQLVLRRRDFPGHPYIVQIARHSYLVNYLFLNLDLDFNVIYRSIKAIFSNQDQVERFIGNVAAEMGPEVVANSQEAVDLFLGLLSDMAGIPAQKITFVMDGLRPALYNPQELPKAEESYFATMRRYFKSQAQKGGYNVVDMQPIFLNHYEQHGERFEFPTDQHWNALGHKLVADSIWGTELFKETFFEVQHRAPGLTGH